MQRSSQNVFLFRSEAQVFLYGTLCPFFFFYYLLGFIQELHYSFLSTRSVSPPSLQTKSRRFFFSFPLPDILPISSSVYVLPFFFFVTHVRISVVQTLLCSVYESPAYYFAFPFFFLELKASHLTLLFPPEIRSAFPLQYLFVARL